MYNRRNFLKLSGAAVAGGLIIPRGAKAGVDPVRLFKDHPGRFPLWHCKDLDKDRNGPAPVAGMKHIFVEHDMPKDAFASITTSYNNLMKIMAA